MAHADRRGERHDDPLDRRPVGEEVVGHIVVRLLVVGDDLGDGGLEVL